MAVPNTEGDERRGEQGFTLVELLVVVLILGILISVAAGTFIGSQKKTGDSAAKSRVTHAVKEQRAVFSDVSDGTYADWATLSQIDKTHTYLDYDSGALPKVMGVVWVKTVETDATKIAQMVSRSQSGKCYWTQEQDGVTSYAVNLCEGPPTVFQNTWQRAEAALAAG